ncbi:MAG: hypothetical protein N2Z21_06500 [Candidatus Sumerlaeaceae bacterium]|nr:hypothetical protein [Candidatus Sumerlaeaceae bacterium]
MWHATAFEIPLRGEAPIQSSSGGAPSLAVASLTPIVSVLVLLAVVHLLLRYRRRQTNVRITHTRTSSAVGVASEENKLLDAEVDSLEVLPLRYCPICRSTYLPNTETCEECSIELQDEPDDEPLTRPSIGNDSTVRIARIPDPIQCNLVVGILQNQGIPCVVSRATVWGNHGGDIYVLLADAFHAKRLVRDYLAELSKERSSS